MKTLIQTSKVLILSIAVLTAVSYVQAEWGNPEQAPTGGNVAAPINVSSSNQDKEGGFSAAALVADRITSLEYCLNGDCIDAWPTGGSEGGGDEGPDSEKNKNNVLSFSYFKSNQSPSSNYFIKNGIADGVLTVDAFIVTFNEPMEDSDYTTLCSGTTYGDDPRTIGFNSNSVIAYPNVVGKTINGFKVRMSNIYDNRAIANLDCIIVG